MSHQENLAEVQSLEPGGDEPDVIFDGLLPISLRVPVTGEVDRQDLEVLLQGLNLAKPDIGASSCPMDQDHRPHPRPARLPFEVGPFPLDL